jgi:putative membrane protein
MGLANLVPGISGGTMLLAAGVYPQFIRGVAEISTFRFRLRSMVLVACVVTGAAIAIVAMAGTVKDLVIQHQWVMYSLFIGLTLGGVPLLWRMVRPLDSTVVVAATVGILAMVALVLVQGEPPTEGGVEGAPGTDNGSAPATAMLLFAGAAGGAAMILPGVSGGYLLLILRQYVVILAAIAAAREAASGRDWAALLVSAKVLVPVAIGVLVGVVGVSNVVKLCLDRFPRATLGFLLGLLLGAVVGLWPFQEPPGPTEVATVATVAATPGHLAAALGLGCVGLGISLAISRLGPKNNGAKAGSPAGR